MDQTLFEDFKQAIFGCLTSLLASLKMLLSFIGQLLLYIVTLGTSGIKLTEEAQDPVARFEYSDEFKDLVFWMMSYNHK